MSDLPLFVVLGATGTQGGGVISHFLSTPTLSSSYRLRGLTRNPSSDSAKALAAKGVEVVSADLNDPASLTTAFDGASYIFSVTDFWSIFFQPSTGERAKKEGKTTAHVAYDIEFQQGKNVIDAAAKVPSLKRLIFSSLADVSKKSGGRYTHVYHFDSKGHAERYAQEEVPEVWNKLSSVHVGMYLSNWTKMDIFRPVKDENGVFVFSASVSGKLPMVAAESDTAAFTSALMEQPLPVGKAVLAYREMMTTEAFVALWGNILNVKTKYDFKPPSQMRQSMTTAMPDSGMAEDMGESMECFAEMGYSCVDVDDDLLHPSEMKVPPKLPSVEEWIRAQDWSKVIDGSFKKADGSW